MPEQLRKVLHDSYGGHCDKPVQDSLMYRPFRIDGSSQNDASTPRGIYVTVEDPIRNTLILQWFNAPNHQAIREAVSRLGGQYQHGPTRTDITITMSPGQFTRVRDLAKTLQRISKSRRQCREPQLKATLQQTTMILNRLGDILASFHALGVWSRRETEQKAPCGPSNAPW